MIRKMGKLAGVLLLSALVSVNLAPTADAAVEYIDHDKVVPIKDITWNGATKRYDRHLNTSESAAKRFQPTLKVVNGCVPFPAVDWSGHVSAGLEPTGAPEGQCSSSEGQVYSRSAWYNGQWAIMYSWYFPKDEPSTGIGHRHDWEAIVVFIDNPANVNPKVKSLAYSEHGQFYKEWPSSLNMNGDHPKVGYSSVWPLDHSLDFRNVVGGTQPLITWEDLSSEARESLNNADFGKASVPFKDKNNDFWRNLEKAWNAAVK
ncbi:NPP1 family protein [Paenibacillus sp. P26]|nr:NPP1 family protein [Paenibacillus sp. P26]UUZ93383.1 NPP1 family protein [Paenibacillus sp. P25]